MLARVPNGESEHAAQMIYAVGAVFFVQVNDALCICVRAEDVAALFQVGAQLREIVDFPILDHPNSFIFVGDRLVAGVQVDDGQTPHSQPYAGVIIESVAVGAAVNDGRVHGFERGALDWGLVRVNDAADSAHLDHPP